MREGGWRQHECNVHLQDQQETADNRAVKATVQEVWRESREKRLRSEKPALQLLQREQPQHNNLLQKEKSRNEKNGTNDPNPSAVSTNTMQSQRDWCFQMGSCSKQPMVTLLGQLCSDPDNNVFDGRRARRHQCRAMHHG